MSEKQVIDSFSIDRQQLDRAITLFDKDCAKDFKLLGLRNRLSRPVYWVAKELMCISLRFVELIAVVLLFVGVGVGVGIYQWAVHGNPPSVMEFLFITTSGTALASVLIGGVFFLVEPIASGPMETLVANAPTDFKEKLRLKAGEGRPLTSHDVHELADAFAKDLVQQETAAEDRAALDLQMVALERGAQSESNQRG